MAGSSTASPVRVVVPIFGDADASSAAQIAASLAGDGGHLVLMGVVPVRRGQDVPSATADARALRGRLRALVRTLPATVTGEALVRAAESIAAGVRQVAEESGGLLVLALPDDGAAAALAREPYRGLVANPPSDLVLVRPRSDGPIRSVLVAARGGPHAELALEAGRRLARAAGAALTVMHVDVPGASLQAREREQHLFRSLVAGAADAPRMRTSSVPSDSPAEAVLAETARHDALVVGARVDPLGVGRRSESGDVGEVPELALKRTDGSVLIAKTRSRVNPAIFRPRPAAVDALVNAWFVENTMHCRDYAAVAELTAEKRARGLRLGVALLAGLSHDTFPAFARVLVDELGAGVHLVDEAVVFCPPEPAIAEAARAAGFEVAVIDDWQADEYGRMLHASLRRLTADVVVWLDADVRNPHAKLVYGLAGPLLQSERLQYVKGFHRLPREAPDADVLDMVDEFAARPLLNLFFAELSGVIDPLGTHHAIRRRAGLALPAFSGPAAPAGLLIDVAHRFGLSAIGQVALEERIARPPSMDEARRRAFSVTQVVTRRAGLSENVLTGSKATPSIKVIHQADERLQIAEVEAHESELPADPEPDRP